MLDIVDPLFYFLQRIVAICAERFLSHYGSRIHSFVYDMDRSTEAAFSGPERPGDRIGSRPFGQKRGMNVEYSFPMQIYESRRKETHIACEGDQVDPQARQRSLDLRFGGTVGPSRVADVHRRHTEPPCPFCGEGASVVMHEQQAVVSLSQGPDKGFEIAPVAAREHGESSHGRVRPRRRAECPSRMRCR